MLSLPFFFFLGGNGNIYDLSKHESKLALALRVSKSVRENRDCFQTNEGDPDQRS